MWLEGVTNPRWTGEEFIKWAKENGWTHAVMEEKTSGGTTWFCLKLYPQRATIKVLWYITGRVGFQGKAPDDTNVTVGAVADAFQRKKEELIAALEGGQGVRTFRSMQRSQSDQNGGELEMGQGRQKRDLRPPTKKGIVHGGGR